MTAKAQPCPNGWKATTTTGMTRTRTTTDMSYSEETMNRIGAALAGGALRSTGADRANDPPEENQAVREAQSDG